MTSSGSIAEPPPGGAPWGANPGQTADGTPDLAGAIYGSLLASSTIIGTSAVGGSDLLLRELLTALIATSLVFWLLHVYVDVIGRELPRHVPWRRAIRIAMRHELPILFAVVPSAAVLAVAILADEPAARVGWWALWAAVAGQVFWTAVALRAAHAGRRVTVVSMAVSLALGLVLVALKAGLSH